MTSYKNQPLITSQTDADRYSITKKLIRARNQQKQARNVIFDYINEEVPQKVFNDDVRRRNEGDFLKDFFEADANEIAKYGNDYQQYRKAKLKELQNRYNEMFEEQVRFQMLQKKQQNNDNGSDGDTTI